MRNLRSVVCATVFGTALLTGGGSAQASKWLTVDVPDGNGTNVQSIGGHNTMIGSTGSRKLFTRTNDGTIFQFGGADDEVAGINGHDIVIGNTTPDGGTYYGFYMGPDDQVHQFGVTGASQTLPTGINGKGDITGGYNGSSGGGSFIRLADGTMKTFAVGLHASAINDARTTAGAYSSTQVFIRDFKGNVTTFSLPNASASITAVNITNDNQVAGSYLDTSSTRHGYIRETDGTIVTFDPPGAVLTNVYAMNNAGDIVGYYRDASGNYHGFTRTPDGTIRTFDAPGSVGYTVFIGIDGSGKVVGSYRDSSNVQHGLRLNAAAAGF